MEIMPNFFSENWAKFISCPRSEIYFNFKGTVFAIKQYIYFVNAKQDLIARTQVDPVFQIRVVFEYLVEIFSKQITIAIRIFLLIRPWFLLKEN